MESTVKSKSGNRRSAVTSVKSKSLETSRSVKSKPKVKARSVGVKSKPSAAAKLDVTHTNMDIHSFMRGKVIGRVEQLEDQVSQVIGSESE